MTQVVLAMAMVPVAFAACGGRALEQGGGAPDSGPNTDAATCVTVDVSTYDRSCTRASDCITISAGTLCDGDCRCGGSTVNADGMAAYDSATSSLSLGDCFCPSTPAPQCIDNQCTICTGAPSDPSSCGVMVGDDTGPSCVDVDISSFDVSCRNDGDCIEVTTGEICSDSCACGGSAISATEEQRYEEETSGIPTEACPCVSAGSPRCVAGSCAICPPPSNPNQPAACLDRDAGVGDN